MKKTFGAFVLTSVLLLVACSTETEQKEDNLVTLQENHVPFELAIPSHFPDMVIPKDNPLTVAKVELGKQLFFDPSLSVDGSVSCASCHLPSKAFSDVLAVSQGVKGAVTERNSPSLMNIGFHPIFMREGAVPTLELQVLSPLEGETEMAHNIVLACERLNQDSTYRARFQEVFGQSATPFTLTRAIAAYERTLIGGDAPFDAYLLGDSTALTPLQQQGYALFTSDRLACSSCHSGVLLSSFALEHNGLKPRDTDPGLMRLTLNEADRGKFKVPSLRNIALTAPYMHDGRFASLEAVIEHYNKGGDGVTNQDERIRSLSLQEDEKEALLAFFDALTEASGKGE